MAVALHADRLTRTFGSRVAVRDLSLSVSAGQIVSLLGPNGAGKTTTLRMLAGLLSPTTGSISIDGAPVSTDRTIELRRSVGILTEAPGLWDGLTVRRNLLTYARLYGLAEPEARVHDVLALVDLADRADEPAGVLSKGLKQRCALARALIHRPSIVLLDEPTAGLDPAAARQVRQLLLQLRNGHRAVLVSTHNLAEAEELSDQIAILKTRLLAVGSPDDLRQRGSSAELTIEFDGDAARWSEVARPHASSLSTTGSRLKIALLDPMAVPDLVSALAAAGARIMEVTSERKTLEDVYLELVEPD
jgi:ABC-2 type transport system ATP-binding protein